MKCEIHGHGHPDPWAEAVNMIHFEPGIAVNSKKEQQDVQAACEHCTKSLQTYWTHMVVKIEPIEYMEGGERHVAFGSAK